MKEGKIKFNVGTMVEHNLQVHIDGFKSTNNGIAPLCESIDHLKRNIVQNCANDDVVSAQLTELFMLFNRQLELEEIFVYTQGVRDGVTILTYLDKEHTYTSMINTDYANAGVEDND